MPRLATIVGPPGTGKTTACLQVIRDWFRRGGSSQNTAYLTFTTDAAEEGVSRLRAERLVGEEKPPYFRTIHSLCYAGMLRQAGRKLNVVGASEMRAFSKEFGMEGAYSTMASSYGDLVQSLTSTVGKSMWDRARMAYEISRITIKSADEIPAIKLRATSKANIAVPVDPDVYRAFVHRYEDWKKREGLVDFTDMLYFGLTAMRPIEGVRFVIVDEAQDLGPLLYLIVERLFAPAEMMVYVGDADQAIYSFSGADAKLFIDRYERSEIKILLSQTRRFGQKIVDFSQSIIKRNRDRIDAPVVGVGGQNHEIVRTGCFKPFVSNALILHRHVAGCQEVGKAFIDAGLPFRNERGRDPLGYHGRVSSYLALLDLSQGKPVNWTEAGKLIADAIPATYVDSDGTKTKFVVHGAKKMIQEDDSVSGRVDLNELVYRNVLTQDGANVIRARNFGVMKNAGDFSYYDRVIRNGYSLTGENVATVTTIHGSKGREAPHVTVFSEMGRRCWQDADTEHRLAYVASSRTQGSLEVCIERKLEWADHPYNYPVNA